MTFFLLFFGHVAFLLAAFGVDGNLQCSHNFYEIFCQVEVKNCLEHKVIIQSVSGHGNASCILQQSEDEMCSCSVELNWIVFGDTHTVKLIDKEKIQESKTISVVQSFHPKTPEILSVTETDGNFGVSWKTNMEVDSHSILLRAQINCYKKGEPEKEWKNINPSTVDGLQYYEINGQTLEMGTIYLVKVRSVANLNDNVSGNSKEWEFKTPASKTWLLSVIITISCIAVLIIIGAIYYCFVKLKTNWWDKLPNPKVSIIHPIKEMMLQPEKHGHTPVYIEPIFTDESKNWSEMSNSDSKSSECESGSVGSSIISYSDAPINIPADINYNLSKLFPNLVSQLTVTSKENEMFTDSVNRHGNKCDGSTSGSSDIVNRSYSFLVPKPFDDNLSDRSDHSSISTPLMIENLCQQLHANPERVLFTGVSPFSSDKVSYAPFPFLPLSKPTFPPFGLNCPIMVVDDYKPIQNPAAQPDANLSVENASDHSKHSERFQDVQLGNFAPTCLNPFFPNNIQTPFPFMTSSSDCILDSEYRSV